MPVSETFATYLESLSALEQQHNWQWLQRTYQLAFLKAKTLHQYNQLGAALQHIPLEQLSQPDWLETTLQIACYSRNAKLILQIHATLNNKNQKKYTAYFAWAYHHQNQYTEALKLLETNFDNVFNAGLAWRAKAESLAATQQQGWQEAFEKAIQKLTGRALGLCYMEYGNQCFLTGQLAKAQTHYNQAYSQLRQDRYYAAWLKYNLGLVTLELSLPEAEQHLYTVQDLSYHKEARDFHAPAWNGIGAIRRSQRQWTRATFAYERGIEHSLELTDRLAAYCGLAHTYRCAGQLNAALQTLHVAIDLDQNTMPDKIRILIAATHIQRNQIAEAEKSLNNLENPKPRGESGLRLQILQAEMLRRQKKHKAAITILKNLDPERLCIREERSCFPELFALADQHNWHAKPLPKSAILHVEIKALGVLEVSVNQCPIHIKPTSKIAELLIFLLEHQNQASTEKLCNALYPKQTKTRSASKALWALCKQLREALGWEDSLIAKSKAYVLGKDNINWDYDAVKTRDKQRLLEGVYSNWLEDIRQNTN